jgi:regulator of sigma E protease
LIKKHAGKPCRLEVKRGGRKVSITAVPASNPANGAGILGVMLAPSAVTVYQVQRPGPPPWRLVVQICRQIFRTVGALVHSRQTGVGVGQLSGPPGILAMLAIELKTDYRLALKFMVLLNLSLAMVNLLPLPVLDGGHIALAVFEKIRRRPLSPRLQQYATMAFAMLLIYFMLYVSYNDVVHWFIAFLFSNRCSNSNHKSSLRSLRLDSRVHLPGTAGKCFCGARAGQGEAPLPRHS